MLQNTPDFDPNESIAEINEIPDYNIPPNIDNRPPMIEYPNEHPFLDIKYSSIKKNGRKRCK